MGFNLFSRENESGYFQPRTWAFWRALIVCFCIFTIVGHWLEIPYCAFMGSVFGIVEDDYAIYIDPWYHPYWVYGIGVVIMTLAIEPFKEHILRRRKTIWGAVLETFAYAVVLSMVMELVIGWIVNQPDEFREYPFWDNSQLPLNIFGQAWLVNDLVIGSVSMLYIWILYPAICAFFAHLKPRTANIVFAAVVIGFAGCCIASYTELIMRGILGG